MRPEVHDWFARRTYRHSQWTAAGLYAAKQAAGVRISVVLPALNEERTVGTIVATIRAELMDAVALVDELVVMDSGSDDGTARTASANGAVVLDCADVLPELGHRPGKGEALWKGLAATTGELVVFADTDVHSFTAGYVVGLLGPLLTDPAVHYVKGMYDRPLISAGEHTLGGGGRVTELVARPLLNLHWPQLAGIVQPLAGEYAGRRDSLERLPFSSGYGVEIGLLIDLWHEGGLDALAQTDLGLRTHPHQDNNALGRMSSEILQTVLLRLARHDLLALAEPPSSELTQWVWDASGPVPVRSEVAIADRPPLIELPAYRQHYLTASAAARAGSRSAK